MMRALRLGLWSWLLLIRGLVFTLFLFRGVAHGELGCLLVAIAEGQATYFAIYNEMVKKSADETQMGLLVPLLYLLSLVIVPVGVGSVFGQWSLAVVAIASIWLRAYLGGCFSAGSSTWCKLVDRGPYRFVRHPLLLLQVLTHGLVLVEFPCLVNLVGLVMFLAATIAVIRLEEKFLLGFAEYSAYSKRVQWRLMPGVW